MKTVFLDRDGVINANRPDHVKTWDEFAFLPGALAALRRLHAAGWRVVVVTNQAIIHRHIVAQAVVEDIHGRMLEVVRASGGRIEAVLYCPHQAQENCDCRKPKPGLLYQAARLFDLALNECYLVGDAFTDIGAGQAAGCTTVLVQTGRGRQQLVSAAARDFTHYYVAQDLSSAVGWLIGTERRRALRERLFRRWPASPAAPTALPRLWSPNSNST